MWGEKMKNASKKPDAIARMIFESESEQYWKAVSLEQNLTFQKAGSVFSQNEISFRSGLFHSYGITDAPDGNYTNFALLLSDQCKHTVKVAVFSDEQNTLPLDSKEFGGSVFQQLNECLTFLMLCYLNHDEIMGLQQIDHPDYPAIAVREALLNALLHRDYSFSGSIIININAKQMEFISIGGLLPGLNVKDICSGISQPRNRRLVELFHRLELTESYGTGIRRIFSLYADHPIQPEIQVTTNTFKIILPNMNAKTGSTDITKQEEQILDFIRKNGYMTDQDVQELLHIKLTRTYILMNTMKEKGLIQIQGRGSEKRFLLP